MLEAPIPADEETLKEPVPRVVEQVLLKCMCKSPGERYPTMRALSDALRAASMASGVNH